jgi:Transposase
MAMLADTVELVIGVDTHKHTHTAAVVVAATGAMVAQVTVAAAPVGYRQLLAWADHQSGRRVWAIEGTGGYGAGLTRFLAAHAEQVVELDRPKRATRRHGAKSDPLDATRAAREALARDQLAQPRATGQRAALSVRLTARRSAVQATGDAQRQLHALVTAAPETLRGRLRNMATPQLVTACRRLGHHTDWDPLNLGRPPPPRPASAPWPAASSSWTPRPPSTPRPSPPWSGPGDLSCSPDAESARSWPHRCCAPGPILAAAAPTPPSRCWAGPPRSPPPAARPSASGSTAPGTASSTRPYTSSS